MSPTPPWSLSTGRSRGYDHGLGRARPLPRRTYIHRRGVGGRGSRGPAKEQGACRTNQDRSARRSRRGTGAAPDGARLTVGEKHSLDFNRLRSPRRDLPTPAASRVRMAEHLLNGDDAALRDLLGRAVGGVRDDLKSSEEGNDEAGAHRRRRRSACESWQGSAERRSVRATSAVPHQITRLSAQFGHSGPGGGRP